MHELSPILNRPEYVHAAINHIPLAGLSVALLALILALPTKNRTAIRIGLGLVALLSLSAWPVYHFGEEGYDRVLSMADEPGAQFLEHHKELGERWIFLYFITAGVAVLAQVVAWKWPRSLLWTSALVLMLGTASVAAGIAIAKVGGQIRHREFRFGPPPTHQHRSADIPSSAYERQ